MANEHGAAALISLRPRFAQALLDGTKCVELRRRKPSIPLGTRVWFYSTLPVGKIVGVGVLKRIILSSPDTIWEEFSHCAGLEQHAFEGYFEQRAQGTALMFSEVAPLLDPIDLARLRGIKPSFHPPQFFQWVRSGELSTVLDNALLGKAFVACDH